MCVPIELGSSLAAVFLWWGNPHVYAGRNIQFCYNCMRTFCSLNLVADPAASEPMLHVPWAN